MTKTDDRIDDLKQVVSGIDNRLCEVEKTISKTREEALTSNLEQYKMITQAVTEGINPIIEKIDKQEKRIICLEQAEAKKALENSKQVWGTIRAVIITVVITFFSTIILNNLIVIATSENQNDIKTEEVSK